MPYGPNAPRREKQFKLKLTEQERERMARVAAIMELTISDAVRTLFKEKAKRLGLT